MKDEAFQARDTTLIQSLVMALIFVNQTLKFFFTFLAEDMFPRMHEKEYEVPNWRLRGIVCHLNPLQAGRNHCFTKFSFLSFPPTAPSQSLSSQELPIRGKHLSNYHHTRWAYCQLLFILTSDSFQGVCFFCCCFFPWEWGTGERSVCLFLLLHRTDQISFYNHN